MRGYRQTSGVREGGRQKTRHKQFSSRQFLAVLYHGTREIERPAAVHNIPRTVLPRITLLALWMAGRIRVTLLPTPPSPAGADRAAVAAKGLHAEAEARTAFLAAVAGLHAAHCICLPPIERYTCRGWDRSGGNVFFFMYCGMSERTAAKAFSGRCSQPYGWMRRESMHRCSQLTGERLLGQQPTHRDTRDFICLPRV